MVSVWSPGVSVAIVNLIHVQSFAVNPLALAKAPLSIFTQWLSSLAVAPIAFPRKLYVPGLSIVNGMVMRFVTVSFGAAAVLFSPGLMVTYAPLEAVGS